VPDQDLQHRAAHHNPLLLLQLPKASRDQTIMQPEDSQMLILMSKMKVVTAIEETDAKKKNNQLDWNKYHLLNNMGKLLCKTIMICHL